MDKWKLEIPDQYRLGEVCQRSGIVESPSKLVELFHSFFGTFRPFFALITRSVIAGSSTLTLVETDVIERASLLVYRAVVFSA